MGAKTAASAGDYAAGKPTAAKQSVQWLEAVLAPPPGAVVKTGGLSLVLHVTNLIGVIVFAGLAS